eukprot:1160038-Pelagomonas_calceolata.AAC.1
MKGVGVGKVPHLLFAQHRAIRIVGGCQEHSFGVVLGNSSSGGTKSVSRWVQVSAAALRMLK